MAKKSFFSKITGSSSEQYDDFYDEAPISIAANKESTSGNSSSDSWASEDTAGGELAVDVYQTPDAIVVKALVAGVQPGSIDISLTREMLTVSGTREDEREVQDENYFQRELYWGSFSRTILLPEEIDVDMAEATEKHGILMIRLPKINKKRQTKLKVRSR